MICNIAGIEAFYSTFFANLILIGEKGAHAFIEVTIFLYIHAGRVFSRKKMENFHVNALGACNHWC